MRSDNILAHIFSFVLQPLLMPLYSIGLLFSYTNFYELYQNNLLRFLIPIFIFSFLMPSLFIVILKKLRLIKDYVLSDRKDRVLPYMMTCFSNSVMVYYFFQSSQIYFWFLGFLAIPVVLTFFAFNINFFWGISPHMVAIGGLIGGTMSVCFNIKGLNPFLLFIVLFILAGCLAVSRLKLKADTPAQVYVGFILGVVLSYLCVWGSSLYIYSI